MHDIIDRTKKKKKQKKKKKKQKKGKMFLHDCKRVF